MPMYRMQCLPMGPEVHAHKGQGYKSQRITEQIAPVISNTEEFRAIRTSLMNLNLVIDKGANILEGYLCLFIDPFL
jgi:hypothetical protein